MRAENYIHIGKFFVQVLCLIHLLRKAPAHRNYHVLSCMLQLFKHTDIAEGMIFGIFAYTACIKDDNIGLFRVIATFIPHA